jgi:hypothetical protein
MMQEVKLQKPVVWGTEINDNGKMQNDHWNMLNITDGWSKTGMKLKVSNWQQLQLLTKFIISIIRPSLQERRFESRCPENGGSRFPANVGIFIKDYTTSRPRSQKYSSIPYFKLEYHDKTRNIPEIIQKTSKTFVEKESIMERKGRR